LGSKRTPGFAGIGETMEQGECGLARFQRSVRDGSHKVSVVSENNSQATFCATLVDEWIRLGLTDVVVCPGSRSTPFA